MQSTGLGEEKSLKHPPGHEERETGSHRVRLGSLHLGDLRIYVARF